METLEYLKEIGLVNQDKENFTIIKENDQEFDLVEVIDKLIEKRLQDVKLRNLAEIENLKKQYNKRIDMIKQEANFKSLETIIELDNDFALAMKMMDPKNIDIVKPFSDKVTKLLDSNNIEEVNTDEYDENLHDVVHVMDSDEQGIEVISKGYRMGDRILKYPKIVLKRPA